MVPCAACILIVDSCIELASDALQGVVSVSDTVTTIIVFSIHAINVLRGSLLFILCIVSSNPGSTLYARRNINSDDLPPSTIAKLVTE